LTKTKPFMLGVPYSTPISSTAAWGTAGNDLAIKEPPAITDSSSTPDIITVLFINIQSL
jgi:hypothetical protein